MAPTSLTDVQVHTLAGVLLSQAERQLRAGDACAAAVLALRALADHPAFESRLRSDLAFADRVECAVAAWKDREPEPPASSLRCDRPCRHCRLTPRGGRS